MSISVSVTVSVSVSLTMNESVSISVTMEFVSTVRNQVSSCLHAEADNCCHGQKGQIQIGTVRNNEQTLAGYQ